MNYFQNVNPEIVRQKHPASTSSSRWWRLRLAQDLGTTSTAIFGVTLRPPTFRMPGMNHWLVKQEPEDYSWAKFAQDGGTAWTGVRNYQARNNLRAMSAGDRVLFYHSGEAKEIVGVARVARLAYPDPSAAEGDWSAVDLKPLKALVKPVPLAAIKADPVLQTMALVRQSRLSVTPVTQAQFDRVLEIGAAKI